MSAPFHVAISLLARGAPHNRSGRAAQVRSNYNTKLISLLLVHSKTDLSISSAQTALPLKVDRRPLLHGGFVCESRYFRLDYKTQNVPSLQVRAVMENL